MAYEYTTITIDLTGQGGTGTDGTLYAELFTTVTLANNDTVPPRRYTATVTSGAGSIVLPCTATAIKGTNAPFKVSFTPTSGAEVTLGRIIPTESATAVQLSDLLEVGGSSAVPVTTYNIEATNLVTSPSIAHLQAVRSQADGARVLVEDVGLYRYSAASAAAANEASIVTPASAVGRWLLELDGAEWRAAYNVRLYGALGDSTGPGTGTNDAAAIQAAIDAAPAGSTILFPDGRYRINTRITWSGKRLSIVGTGRASIVEGTAITGANAAGAMLYVNGSDCNGTTIDGLDFEGVETKAGFVGGDTKEYCAIYASSVTDLTVRQVKVTGKSWGAILDTCVGARVVDLTFTSFLDTAASGAGAGTDNYNSAVRIKAGDRNLIYGLIAKDCGSGVQAGTNGSGIDPTRLTLEASHVENTWDNGVYFSSAQDSLVADTTIKTSAGTGIKVRGSCNRVLGCTTRATLVGIGISGAGSSPDAYGATSHGCIVANNTIEATGRDGLVLDTHATYTARHTLVSNNYFRNIATEGGGYAAIRADGNYYQIRLNIIEDANGTTAAIIAGGTVSVPAIGLDISHNQVFDSTGDGMRLQYLQNSIVSHNLFRTIASDAIQLRNSTGNQITHNKGVTGLVGDIVDATSANSNTGNLILFNEGTHNVDAVNNFVTFASAAGLNFGGTSATTEGVSQFTAPASGRAAIAISVSSGVTGLAFSADGSYGYLDYDTTSTNGVRLSALNRLLLGVNANAAYPGTFTEGFRIMACGTGYMGMGSNGLSPTAQMHLYPQSTPAGSAPLKFTTGASLMTTPEAGAFEFSGNLLYFTPDATRERIFSGLTNTATLDFGSIAAGATAELTITVTGAAVGDVVLLGPPAALEAGLVATGIVTATNTVTVRLANVTSGAIDPASATWRATVLR